METYKKIVLFLWPSLVFALYFFNGIPQSVCKMTRFIAIIVTLFYLTSSFFRKYCNNTYSRLVLALFWSIIISMLMSYLARGQGLILSFRVNCTLLSIIYFFLLLKWHPSLSFLEKLILTYAIINVTLWIIALLYAPTPIFSDTAKEEYDSSRGVFRINVQGYGLFILAFFYVVQQYKLHSKKIWIILAVLMYLVIVLHVIRQIIIFSLLTALLYYFWNKRWRLITIIVVSYIALQFITFSNISDESVLGNLVNQTTSQYENQMAGNDDIRVREYRYFFFEFPNTVGTMIFGNGIPHTEGPYGKLADYFMHQLHFYPVDVGYATIYFYLGALGLSIYLFLLRKVIKQKVPDRWFYIKLFILYEIPANIAASWYFADMLTIAICLYMLEMIRIGETSVKAPSVTIIRAI